MDSKICPKCGKHINKEAKVCPNCGRFFMRNLNVEAIDKAQCPKVFSCNLKIGQQITNWKSDSAIKGYYSLNGNTIINLPKGNALIVLHTHGIRVVVKRRMYDIHNSQIINIRTSQLDSNDNLQKGCNFIINFWDVKTRTEQSISILCDESQKLGAFIARYEKECEINISEGREPEDEYTPLWLIICLIVIIGSIILIFAT